MGWGAFDVRFGCARAHEIFFFSRWSCTIPSKKRKKRSGQIRVRARTPRSSHLNGGSRLVRRPGVRSDSTLGSTVIRPWGQRASQVRVRARAGSFFL